MTCFRLATMMAAMGVTALGGPLPLGIAGDSGHVYVGAFDPPKATATDFVNLRYTTPGSSETKTLSIPVDISKEWSGADKADCICAALNARKSADPSNPDIFKATSLSNSVSVVGQNGAQIVSIGMNENSKQRNVTWQRLPNAMPSSGSRGANEPPKPMMSEISFDGEITGHDPDGLRAQVTIGTKRGSRTFVTWEYSDTAAMVDFIVSDLEGRGFDIEKTGDTSFKINYAKQDGSELRFCCTDEGCSIGASLGEHD